MKPKTTTSVYLDYAAATPLDEAVLSAMQPYLTGRFANPSASYTAAREAHAELEDWRARAAKVLGAKKTEIVFTAGGTESDNLVIFGVARRFPGSKLVASAIEHDAVLNCLRRLEKEGHTKELVPVTPKGVVETAAIVRAIDDDTVLVSVGLANSEIGTIQPLADIARAIMDIRRGRQSRGIDLPLYLHTDAAQAAGYVSLAVDRLGVDLLSINGGKIYGPKRSGLLYVKSGTELLPLIEGGGQERGLRSGTEDLSLVAGFVTALEIAESRRGDETKRLSALRDSLLDGLKDLPGFRVNGEMKRRLPGNLNFMIDGIGGDTAVLYLDREGFAVSTGSACAAADEAPSHVLLALGLSEDEARASLRLTLGRSTTQKDIAAFVKTFQELLPRLLEVGRTGR